MLKPTERFHLGTYTATTFSEPTQATNTTSPNENANSQSVDLVLIGSVATAILAVLIITLILAIAVCKKVGKCHKNEVSTVGNETFGVTIQDTATHTEDVIYDYPIMFYQAAESIDTKQNEAYATKFNIKPRVGYAY